MFTIILSSDFVSFTSTTIFEFSLLKNFDSHLIYNHASFKGYSNSYNHFFNSFTLYINNISKRCILNRERLSEAWFYYRFIVCYNEIYSDFENCPMPFVKDLDIELNKIKSQLQPHFIKKWSTDCHTKNCINLLCSTAIVIDGNHKINRLKCLFEDKFVKVPELDGMF